MILVHAGMAVNKIEDLQGFPKSHVIGHQAAARMILIKVLKPRDAFPLMLLELETAVEIFVRMKHPGARLLKLHPLWCKSQALCVLLNDEYLPALKFTRNRLFGILELLSCGL